MQDASFAGLEYIHSWLKIVHRDLKQPQNLLYCCLKSDSVKIADFGTSLAASSEKLKKPQGTFAFFVK